MKENKWLISVLTNRPSRHIKKVPLYSNDEQALLHVELLDKDLEFHSVTFTLYNTKDDSLISQAGEVVEGVATFTLTSELLNHSGVWEFQVIFEGAYDYVSDPLTIEVIPYLLDENPPKLILIDDWKKYKRQVSELIGGIEESHLELVEYVQQVEKMEGPRGPRGYKGEKGDSGETGEQGPQGIRGPRGYQGAEGETGPRGYKGDKGDTGEQGPRGVRGPDGPQGLRGLRGPQGPQGARGVDGLDNISSYRFSSTGNWVKFDNGIMIQWYIDENVSLNFNNQWGGWYYSNMVSWRYPESFIHTPVCICEYQHVSGEGMLMRTGSGVTTITSGQFMVLRPTAFSNGRGDFHYYAIGRWK